MATVVSFCVALTCFLASHTWAGVRFPDARAAAFAISRGRASIALVAVGLTALLAHHDAWQRGFLAAHARGSLADALAALGLAHFCADLIWMGRGAARGEPQRKDLVFHHLFGVGMFGATLALGAGQATVAITLLTEALVLTSGLEARARLQGDAALLERARRLRLAVLTLWRIPFWICLCALIQLGWWTAGDQPFLRALALPGAVIAVTLDVAWARRAARRAPGRAAEGSDSGV